MPTCRNTIHSDPAAFTIYGLVNVQRVESKPLRQARPELNCHNGLSCGRAVVLDFMLLVCLLPVGHEVSD